MVQFIVFNRNLLFVKVRRIFQRCIMLQILIFLTIFHIILLSFYVVLNRDLVVLVLHIQLLKQFLLRALKFIEHLIHSILFI